MGKTQIIILHLILDLKVINLDERRDLLYFFLLTYVFSWFFTVPFVLRSQGILNIGFTGPSAYIASFGPAFAAIIPFLPLG